MKKNVLIVYGYERIIPAFMQTLLKYSATEFDHIVYVTPPMNEYYMTLLDSKTYQIVTWNTVDRFKQLVKGCLSPFRINFWKELLKGNITKGSLFNVGKQYFCSDGFIGLSKKIIEHHISLGNEVYLLGTWFSVEAFAIARLKKLYPSVKGFALAHSGEVISARNPYMHQCYHEFMFENLDRVFFISRKVMNNYLKDMEDIRLKERFGNKMSLRYLGSTKQRPELNPPASVSKITILSCSRIDANKRLDKIISALGKWNGPIIKWIHIGTGIEEQKIRTLSKSLENKENVEIEFKGRMPNEEVIDFYAHNHVDLFINVSRSEGLPISIMEAMSYGIPAIATDVGGTSEIVNSSNGYLLDVEFKDEDLLAYINEFLSMSEHEKGEFRNNAFKVWSVNFNAHRNSYALFKDMKNIPYLIN